MSVVFGSSYIIQFAIGQWQYSLPSTLCSCPCCYQTFASVRIYIDIPVIPLISCSLTPIHYNLGCITLAAIHRGLVTTMTTPMNILSSTIRRLYRLFRSLLMVCSLLGEFLPPSLFIDSKYLTHLSSHPHAPRGPFLKSTNRYRTVSYHHLSTPPNEHRRGVLCHFDRVNPLA